MREFQEDTYFLDRELAYQIALKQNLIIVGDSCEQVIQNCYYNGNPFTDAPANLISVPVSQFTDFFVNNDFRIPTFLCCKNTNISKATQAKLEPDFLQMVATIKQSKKNAQKLADHLNRAKHKDGYFLDRREAYRIACQNNRVKLDHPTVDGLQICYHAGAPFPDPPPNLVSVPAGNLLGYFCETRLRLPQCLVFPQDTRDENKKIVSEQFPLLLNEARIRRKNTTDRLVEMCRAQAPVFAESRFRIVFLASRLTNVMQYASKNLAKAFKDLGHQVHVITEQNDMEELDYSWILKEYYDWNPHITVHINHHNAGWLHPSVFNVVWWQDFMPDLLANKKIDWRPRDIIFSATPQLDVYVKKTGAPEIRRQHFCIDSEIFKPEPTIRRRKMAVFIGSSYRSHIANLNNESQKRIKTLVDIFAAGQPITKEMIAACAEKQPEIPYGYFWSFVFCYIVRDTAVRWLCEAEDIEVEVYGRDWEDDKIVSKHFKGELRHGRDVAKVYNEAQYALVAHCHDVNSQRLVEAASCGAVPLVYDCRYHAELPHWDKECLFFRTKEQLHQCLKGAPANNPITIARDFTYTRMAQNILEIVRGKS